MNARNLAQPFWCFCLVVGAAMVGCSPTGPPPSGVVRFRDGEPVRSGSIEFRSLETGDRFAGRISEDGSFTLSNEDDVPSLPPGEYQVVVVQIVITEDLAESAHEHGRTVPRRYADYHQSDLRFLNQADRSDPIIIELEDSP